MAAGSEFGLPPMASFAPLASMAPLTWLPGAARQAEPDAAEQARFEAAAGDAFYLQGQFRAALYRFEDAVALRPGEREYHYKLARAARRAEEPRLVEPHLLEAVRLDPDYAPAHNALGLWYRESGRLDEALRHTSAALALEPANADFAVTRASVLSSAGQARAAWDLLRPLVADETPGLWPAWLYAQVAPKLGREHEERAAAVVRRALGAPGLSADAQRSLHFAAAALLDKMGRYDEAFDHARRGNETFRLPHDPAAQTEFVDRRIRYFTPARLKALPRATHTSRRPVFIVGMPRSGTSLVEQILASHPQVYGAGELTTLARIAASVNDADWCEGQPYPECLDALTVRRANRLAAEYLSAIDALDKDATYVTDKMPLNVLGLELVQLLLPGSRVIHCVRDAIDTCLSCYLTGFSVANEFTFDLAHLGAYYRDSARLVAHWKKVLSLPVLEVRYQDVVLDTEEETRRMLEFLDLPWDERCLRFYENPRRVATASEDQVRRPVYTSSIGRWKNYERHLPDLLQALGRRPAGEGGAGPRAARPSPTARGPAFAGLY
jgi:tetratricopeptide (TPR) repeat protein